MPGGRGAYVTGNIQLRKDQMLYIAVGAKGVAEGTGSTALFNNGAIPFSGSFQLNLDGKGTQTYTTNGIYTGGGATDFRLNSGNGIWYNTDSLQSRIVVAGAGGGAEVYHVNQVGGAAGALIGYPGGNGNLSETAVSSTKTDYSIKITYYEPTTGGTQSAGGQNGMGYHWLFNADSSQFAGCVDHYVNNSDGTRTAVYNNDCLRGGFGRVVHAPLAVARGGNGYYAGGSGPHSASVTGAGAGGSSYVSGYSDSRGSCDTLTDSTLGSITFTSANMIDGKGTMTSPAGAAETGHAGDGYARITLISTNFTIINQVTGSAADQNLNFTYTLSGLSSNTAHSYIRYSSSDGSTWSQSQSGSLLSNASGTISFQLKHNEKIVVIIPAEKTISVSRNENQHYFATNSLGSRNVANGISVNTTDTISFLNVHTDNISVRKIWNDNENSDGYRSGVCLELLADGFDTCHSAQLSAAGNAVGYTFSGVTSGDYSVIESGETCPAGLPAAYRQVEWIQSTGTQYIDTGVAANSNTEFDVDFIPYNVINTDAHCIFGSWNRTSSEYGYQLNIFKYSSSSSWVSSLGSSGYLFTGSVSAEYVYEAGMVSNTRLTCSLHNSTYSSSSGIQKQVRFYPNFPTVNITIWARNTEFGPDQFSSARLYSLKLYSGTNKIRDFIPCYRISDGEIGLYDIVNDVFYTNQGTGTFYKGPDCITAVNSHQ